MIARIRAMLAPTDPVGYVGPIQAIGDGDLREDTMHERIAGSELSVIPKAAHCSCVEAADEFNRALLDFLARVR